MQYRVKIVERRQCQIFRPFPIFSVDYRAVHMWLSHMWLHGFQVFWDTCNWSNDRGGGGALLNESTTKWLTEWKFICNVESLFRRWQESICCSKCSAVATFLIPWSTSHKIIQWCYTEDWRSTDVAMFGWKPAVFYWVFVWCDQILMCF